MFGRTALRTWTLALATALAAGASALAATVPYDQPNVGPGPGVVVTGFGARCPLNDLGGNLANDIGGARFCVPHIEAFIDPDQVITLEIRDLFFSIVGGTLCQIPPDQASCALDDGTHFCKQVTFTWIPGRDVLILVDTAFDSVGSPCGPFSFGTRGDVSHD